MSDFDLSFGYAEERTKGLRIATSVRELKQAIGDGKCPSIDITMMPSDAVLQKMVEQGVYIQD